MGKLVILRGNSGSGKTTVSKVLQKKFGRNTLLLGQDMIRREVVWVKDEKGNKSIPLFVDLLKYGRAL